MDNLNRKTDSTSHPKKVWLTHYPKDVPQTIDARAYDSVVDVFESTVAKFTTKPAFSNMGCTFTFQDIDRQSRQFAAYLQSIPGLKKGDRIAIQLPNLLQFPVALFGAMRAGLTVINTNPLYTEREMEFQFNDAGAKAIVICANFAVSLEKIIARTSIETVIVTEIGDCLPFPKRTLVNSVIKYVKKMVPKYNLPRAISFRAALEAGDKLEFRKVELSSEDLALLQYTGGTTGVAKGAMITHGNIVANMEQVAAWMRPRLGEGGEICITPLPMYHIFSLTVNCLAFFKYGTLNVLITNPRDLKAVIKEMSKWKFTLMTGVNTLFNALMHHKDFTSLNFSHLKLVVGGGMAVQKPVAERWQKITGTPLIEGYGLTETSPVACCNPPSGEIRLGTVGFPLPSTEVWLRKEDGSTAAEGESGEVCIRGPQVMKGYWKRPDESANVLLPDGWLRTGDIGQFTDEGYLKIVDRQKDMIVVSGFKVFPNEVEEVLASHPKVLEAGVIGVEDPRSGEHVKACVVKKDPSLTEKELIEFAHKHLTNYKVPREVVFLDALPKTNVGKILRRELR